MITGLGEGKRWIQMSYWPEKDRPCQAIPTQDRDLNSVPSTKNQIMGPVKKMLHFARIELTT